MSNFNDKFYYSTASGNTTISAAPTDIVTISGNDTTNVYVTHLSLSTYQTTEGINAWVIAKRIGANSGGTSANSVAVNFNSKNPLASAEVLIYSANPTTLGAPAGYVWAGLVDSPELTPTETGDSYAGIQLNFLEMFGSPIALLSHNELLSFNFNGQTLPAGMQIFTTIGWYETYK